jgi:hypothetical protein
MTDCFTSKTFLFVTLAPFAAWSWWMPHVLAGASSQLAALSFTPSELVAAIVRSRVLLLSAWSLLASVWALGALVIGRDKHAITVCLALAVLCVTQLPRSARSQSAAVGSSAHTAVSVPAVHDGAGDSDGH